MVEAEFDMIWQQVEADKAARRPAARGRRQERGAAAQAEYRKIAERRVRLGLVLAEIGRARGVSVTDEELAQAMRAEAMRYRGQEQQVFDLLRQNPNAQAQLRAPLHESVSAGPGRPARQGTSFCSPPSHHFIRWHPLHFLATGLLASLVALNLPSIVRELQAP